MVTIDKNKWWRNKDWKHWLQVYIGVTCYLYSSYHSRWRFGAEACAPALLKVNWTISLSHQLLQIIKLERCSGSGWADHTPPCPPPLLLLTTVPALYPHTSPRTDPRSDVLSKMSVAVRSARGRLSLAEEKDGRMCREEGGDRSHALPATPPSYNTEFENMEHP